jgi:two-component system nitrogen regulation sensor histidine kinase NtrY
LPARGRDEFAQLMRSFNQMAADLREGQRALAARRSYLESVLGNLSAGVLVIDAQARTVESNNAAERLLGARRAEFVQRVMALSPGAQLIASEITLRMTEGPRTLRCVVDPVQREDGTSGWLVLFDDVTELLANRRLSLYAEMARQVAHEVKNPLTPIQLAAQMIRQAYRDRHARVDEIVEESVDQIERQVARLRGIVAEFSMLGRAEPLQLAPIPVRPLLEEIRSLYPSPDGRLVIELEVEPKLVVLAQREAIVKVLSNLVENARHAVGERGRIRLQAHGESDQVSLRVLDDGPGLSAEVEERLFEPYFSTKHSGTGLGLVICRSLVERMGGAEAELRLGRPPLDGGNDS